MRLASTYRAMRRNIWREDRRYTWVGLPENSLVTQPTKGKKKRAAAKKLSKMRENIGAMLAKVVS